jgi:serine/threonine protein kinase
MPLAPGTRVGVYEIIAAIGAGGMGEVYRARDRKLDRDVAIKILPEAVAADPDRIARFEREAKTLAALNHPNIAHIHGLEESDGIRALIMELVEGPTLSDCLTKGPLPIKDALTIATQIADALEAAHEKGIIHRDLKPANIKISSDGRVKLLDFGIAKLAVGDAPSADLTQAPTVTVGRTREGALLGTAAYMSPEQARGLAVDKRSDIWAFGSVLFEILVGRRCFPAVDVASTLSAILRAEPEWAALSESTPSSVLRLLHRCLEKDPRRRLHDIADARIEIDDALSGREQSYASSTRPVRLTLSVAVLATTAALVIGAWAGGFFWRKGPSITSPAWARGALSFSIEPEKETRLSGVNGQFALSPDGRTLAWTAAGSDGITRLWIRSFDSSGARVLPGTEGASTPFWSPNGHGVGFQSQTVLKIVDLASGVALQTLSGVPSSTTGATWSRHDVIVFSSRLGLYQMPAGGGSARLVATVDKSHQEDTLRFPQFLPDGQHFLYVARSGRPGNSAAYVGDLEGKSTRLFESLSKVEYSPPGYVLFVRDGTLMARRFDVETLAVGSETFPVTTGVATSTQGLAAAFAASANGVLAYRGGALDDESVLRWFDRSGRPGETLGVSAPYSRFRLSPDGRKVATAFSDERTGGYSTWVLEPGRSPSRLTFAGTSDWTPTWSPDGTRIAFASSREGPYNLYVKPVSGLGEDEALLPSSDQSLPEDWSADGRFLAYRKLAQSKTSNDVFVLPLFGDHKPIPIAESDAEEVYSRFSPRDGRWIAYASNETGRMEVFVQAFPPTGAKWQISNGGGSEPNWSGDGRELFYLTPQGTLMSVEVQSDASTFSVGPSRPLFAAGRPTGPGENRYDVTRDAKRFLVSVPVDRPQAPVTIILNWQERLSASVPTK